MSDLPLVLGLLSNQLVQSENDGPTNANCTNVPGTVDEMLESFFTTARLHKLGRPSMCITTYDTNASIRTLSVFS